ncbi:MAG: hypothetical protein H6Q16_619 [Bacteroidetes bacterium]|nr:hypothetical protein [Bacteroidota bacterium]
MEKAQKLLAFILIAVIAIGFTSCETDDDSKPTKPVTPTEETYPIQIPSPGPSCPYAVYWDTLSEHGSMEDWLYIINDQETLSRYVDLQDSTGNCQINFVDKTVLLAYTWTRNLNPSEIKDTLWKLSSSEFRWALTYNYSVAQSAIGRSANMIVVPKIADTATVSLYVLDEGVPHP